MTGQLPPIPTGERVLITGGAGFIGSHLAAALAPENEVVLLDNLARNALAGTGLTAHPHVTLVVGDVLNPAAVESALDGVTLVVHCAAVAGVSNVRDHPVRTMRVNLSGTLNVLDAVAARPEVRRLVQLSTSEVYGSMAWYATEACATSVGAAGEPRWSYAISKLCGDHLAAAWHQELGLPVVTLRPFNVYGPGQVGEGAIQRFVADALAGRALRVRGDGAAVRSWCFVSDFIGGLLAALTAPEAVGQVFNLGNPRATATTRELAEAVQREAGSAGRIEHQVVEGPDVDVRVPDISKAMKILGFTPVVGLGEGIQRTLHWARGQA